MRYLFFFLLLILHNTSFAAQLRGTVKAANGDALSFANVFIINTGAGTTTNSDGFYSIELTPGEYDVLFKYLGYKTTVEKVVIADEDVELNILLQPESIWISEVVVKPGAEDPAYAIIRNAIANKKINKNEVNDYECQAYIKGLQRLDKYPKKILGVKINIDEYVDPKTGIVYLSESVSNLKWKFPDKINEEIISSKVSGNNRAFSFNRASDFIFSVYDNLIDIGISKRMFISPVSNNAFFYYKFRLEGTTSENDQIIYKIRLLPMRQHDPVFRGYIYITENRWRVQSIDLVVTKDAIIEFVDTLRIKQVVLPVKDDIWMPVSLYLSFNFKAFGFEGNGYYAANYYNYKFKNNFSKKIFKGEVITIKKEANERKEEYWEQVRPIPLTFEEKTDYIRKDSIFQIKETETYKDSVDAVNNEFSFSKLLLTGLTIQKRKYKTTYSFSPLIESAGFNTVQGWNAGILMTYHKRLDDYKRIFVSPSINYGFADERFNASITTGYSYNRQKFASTGFSGGRSLVQFNSLNPVGIFSNTISTLFYENNYLKLYSKNYFNVNHQIEIFNGFKSDVTLEYAVRSAVENSSDYKVKDYKDRYFTPNNPYDFEFFLNDTTENYSYFKNHKSLNTGIKLTFKPGAKYYSRPSGKWLMDNNNPLLHFNISVAIPYADDAADFIFAEAGATQTINMKNAGNSLIVINGGKFLHSKNLIFPDWKHFNGNRMALMKNEVTHFRLLDYYRHSTTKPFTEFHAEHDFAGYLFNKIPGIRKLKLTEVAGFHALSIKDEKPYFELSFGIQKIGIRFEYAFSPAIGYKSGAFRFSMPF